MIHSVCHSFIRSFAHSHFILIHTCFFFGEGRGGSNAKKSRQISRFSERLAVLRLPLHQDVSKQGRRKPNDIPRMWFASLRLSAVAVILYNRAG